MNTANFAAASAANSEPCRSAVTVELRDIIAQIVEVREHFNISDRALTVLQALAACTSEVTAQGLPVAFVSNKKLAMMLGNMPLQTLGRHLRALRDRGLAILRASANAKRYARRDPETAQITDAYGYDLSPLLLHRDEIVQLVAANRQEQAARQRMRDALSLVRRSFPKGSPIDLEISRIRRRKTLTADELQKHVTHYQELATQTGEASKVRCSDSQIERHQYTLKKIFSDSAPASEVQELPEQVQGMETEEERAELGQGIEVVLQSCSRATDFMVTPVHSWEELYQAARVIAPQIGLSIHLERLACDRFGRVGFAILVCALTHRFSDVSNPAGYFRSLVERQGDPTKILHSVLKWAAKS